MPPRAHSSLISSAPHSTPTKSEPRTPSRLLPTIPTSDAEFTPPPPSSTKPESSSSSSSDSSIPPVRSSRLTKVTLERDEWRSSARRFRDLAKEAGEERTKLLVECEALRRKIAERNSQDEREEESLKGLLEENRVLREELEEANERVEELEGVVGRFREGVGVWLGILGRVGVGQEDALQIADRVDEGMEVGRAVEEVLRMDVDRNFVGVRDRKGKGATR